MPDDWLSGSGTYARVFAGRVQLEEEGEPRPCAVKRLSVDKGLRPERLLQEALTMTKCQDPSRPLLRAVALGDDQYCLVSWAAGRREAAADRAALAALARPTKQPAAPSRHLTLIFLSLSRLLPLIGTGAHGSDVG